MLANSSDSSSAPAKEQRRRPRYRWGLVILLPLWVAVSFGIAQLMLVALLYIFKWVGISLTGINSAVVNTAIAAFVYVLTLVIVVGVPWLIKKYRTTKDDIGLTRLLSWTDILFAPAGFVIYLLSSALLVYIAGVVAPNLDLSQTQETGFKNIVYYHEYVLAFMTLIVIAPIAEEILFRGYLYGKLRNVAPLWVAVLVTSGLFGLVHGQWNVGIDVFALSIVLCTLREVTGNIWAGVLVHMLKNSLAFYILFINPTFFHTMGG